MTRAHGQAVTSPVWRLATARVHVEIQGETVPSAIGDPVRMAGAYLASYDREPYKAPVRAFLDRD